MHHNWKGVTVKQEWEHATRIRENIELFDYISMASHLHGIVAINDCTGRVHRAYTKSGNVYFNKAFIS